MAALFPNHPPAISRRGISPPRQAEQAIRPAACSRSRSMSMQFSLLDGACRIKKLVERVKELGQEAVAITDHGCMYGVVDFYRACKAAGVKPIIGCEVYPGYPCAP